MEAVGAAASILQIVTVAIQSAKVAYETISTVVNAPESVSSLQNQIKGLLGTLNGICELTRQCQNLYPRSRSAQLDSALGRLRVHVKTCVEDVANIQYQLDRLVEGVRDGRTRKMVKRVKVILQQEDLKRWNAIFSARLNELEGSVAVLNGHLTPHQNYQIAQSQQHITQLGISNIFQHDDTRRLLMNVESTNSILHNDTHRKLANIDTSLCGLSSHMDTHSANISQLVMNSSQSQSLIRNEFNNTQNMIQRGFQRQCDTSDRLLTAMDKLSLELDAKFTKSQDMIAMHGNGNQQLMSMMSDLMAMMQQVQANSNQSSLTQHPRPITDAKALEGNNFNNANYNPAPQPHDTSGRNLINNFNSVANNLDCIRLSGRRSLGAMSPEVRDIFKLFDKAVQKKEVISDVEYMDWEERLETTKDIERAQSLILRAGATGKLDLTNGGLPSYSMFDDIKSTELEFQGLNITLSTQREKGIARSVKLQFPNGSHTDYHYEELVTTTVKLAKPVNVPNSTGYSELQISFMVTESITRYGNLLRVPYLQTRNVRLIDESTQRFQRAVSSGDIETISKLFSAGEISSQDYFYDPHRRRENSLLQWATELNTFRFFTLGVVITQKYPREVIDILEQYNFHAWFQFMDTNFLTLIINTTRHPLELLERIFQKISFYAENSETLNNDFLQFLHVLHEPRVRYIISGLLFTGGFLGPPEYNFFIVMWIFGKTDAFTSEENIIISLIDGTPSWSRFLYTLAHGFGLVARYKHLFARKGIPLPTYPLSLQSCWGGVSEVRNGKSVIRKEGRLRNGLKMLDVEYDDIVFTDEKNNVGAYLRDEYWYPEWYIPEPDAKEKEALLKKGSGFSRRGTFIRIV
ncbi:hypothetical protein AA313_de0209080 [Arthrobotrys entomopaga]|nr:hypothetical protein AA313_de0209080 [Arthrobotrys entomopaga]